jgi:MFS family permease
MGGQARTSDLRVPALFLSTMVLGYAVYAIDRTVLSAVLVPMKSALALNNAELGLLAAAQYIGVLVVVFAAGSLSDRYGRLRIVLVGLIVFTAFTWLVGLASSFAEAFAFRFASGLGEGIFWPVAMASVASYFGGRKGFALGIFYVGFDAGSAAGPALAGVALTLTANWRYAFFIAPLVGIVPIALALFQESRSYGVDRNVEGLRLGRDALRLVRERNVVAIMLFAFLATWASVWQVVFLPYYFNKVLHYDVIYAAFLTPVVPISGAAGKIILGRLSDDRNRRSMLALISVVVTLSFLAFFSSTGIYAVVSVAVIMSFFSSSVFPIMQALMVDSSGTMPGAGLGLNTTSQSVAAVLSLTVAASLFSAGVGMSLAANAIVSAALMAVVAMLLKDPRVRPKT